MNVNTSIYVNVNEYVYNIIHVKWNTCIQKSNICFIKSPKTKGHILNIKNFLSMGKGKIEGNGDTNGVEGRNLIDLFPYEK